MNGTPIPPPVDTGTCPFCGSLTEIRPATAVYGPRGADWGEVLICVSYPACDAYVGIHRNTKTPKGTLADKALRLARKDAHAAFDPWWQSGRMRRAEAYERLSSTLKISREHAHIGWFTAEQCREVVKHFAHVGMKAGA